FPAGTGPLTALLQAAKENSRARQLRELVRSAARTAALVALIAGAAALLPTEVAAQEPAASIETIAQTDTMLTRLAPQIDVRVGEQGSGLRLSGTVGVVVMMGLLTLLPTLILMMTSFT